MPEHKPHHKLVMWAAEHAPETDRNLLVEVCPEAFNHLLCEGMKRRRYLGHSDLVGRREGVVLLENGAQVGVLDQAKPGETVLLQDYEPFYTLKLTAHQKMAFAAAVEAARAEKDGVAS